MRWLPALVASLASLAWPGAARADFVESVLGCTGNPCVVRFNPGGELRKFEAAARMLKKSGRRVVIDGPCASACAILADRARSKVCVTSNAKFGFHKGAVVRVNGYGPAQVVGRFNPTHSKDIAGWVKKRGGYPSQGFRVMGAGEARRIWRPC